MKVSIFMSVRNGAASIERALQSLKAQTIPIEIIIQDGNSTDDTPYILQDFFHAAKGMNLHVVSEEDSGPSEGLVKAINRCTGDTIGSCMADEELMPDACEFAATWFKFHECVALTGDAILTDLQGNEIGQHTGEPFTLEGYRLCDQTPYFCASFFRRESLPRLGGLCPEFDLWHRIGHQCIDYVPKTLAKYAVHAGQSSNKPEHILRHFKGRIERLKGLPNADAYITGHLDAFRHHAEVHGLNITAELERLCTR